MNHRLKQARKALKLSQEVFGRRVGVTGAAISRIEVGDRALTDQMILAVCREYKISYDWLVYGTGAMFESPDDTLQGRVDELLSGDNETAKNLFRAFAELDDDEWRLLSKMIDKIKSAGH